MLLGPSSCKAVAVLKGHGAIAAKGQTSEAGSRNAKAKCAVYQMVEKPVTGSAKLIMLFLNGESSIRHIGGGPSDVAHRAG